jgi:hypothetical protein
MAIVRVDTPARIEGETARVIDTKLATGLGSIEIVIESALKVRQQIAPELARECCRKSWNYLD